jgi:uncharacterized protein
MFSSKLVKTAIAEDFFGVFAKEDIAEGEIVFSSWNDNCVWLTSDQILKLKEPYKSFYEKYCTEIKEHTYIGPAENEDISWQLEYFINHSCDPNVWLVNDEDVAARRAIKAGEHITIDYATFIINEFDSSKISNCLCGSVKCRGKLSDMDWFKLKDVYRGHFISWIEEKIKDRENSDKSLSERI